MDRLLTILERRLGRFAPSNLTYWLVGLQGAAYILLYARPELMSDFVLAPALVARGEVWRLVTFLFMPWSTGNGILGPLWMVFAMMMLYTIGTSLESAWGSFRFDAYLLIAMAATILSSLLFGGVTNQFIMTSLWLAFAVEFPDYEILLFFILPVKMKWLGLLSGAYLVWGFITGGMAERAGTLVAMAAFALFCGRTLLDRARGIAGVRSRSKAMDRYRADSTPVRRVRVCARCGKSEKDDPRLEFRVCDCQEKCGGRLTDYCLEHARNH
jgi:hypothetical protein